MESFEGTFGSGSGSVSLRPLAYGFEVFLIEIRLLLEREELFSNIGAVIVFLVGGRFALGEKSSDRLADVEVAGEVLHVVHDSLAAVALPGGVTLRAVIRDRLRF